MTLKNWLLLAILAGLIALHWAVPSDATKRNVHFMPDMVDSLAYDAQAPAPTGVGDLKIDLRPPLGSVARGHRPLPFDASPEDALRAGEELASPLDADDPTAGDRGAFVFETFCATCHGAGGEGDGRVTKKGVPPPPSLLAPRAREMGDGQIYHIITFGQANMASYASQVERDDRWKVVRYIRNLQEATAPQ